MIKKLIRRLLGQTAPVPPALPDKPAIPLGRRVEVPAAEHGIDVTLVDERAARVVRTLKAAGFEAYIVGGAVRDLLVGRRPKDFDVATNATPEQVKAQFRRAFIIGRRFRIVHVIHGRGRDHEVIEVSTFRAFLDSSDATQIQGNEKTSKAELVDQSHAVDSSGRVLRDNVWGPQVEDAARRDFTVNALYYDPETQIVVDYHDGLADVRARVLRLIGDPAARYREDPVRIIRAVRFAAKLGFSIEARTAAPIDALSSLLNNVPVSRLFDEMIKLLQTGHALASLDALAGHGLLGRGVFPVLDAAVDERRSSAQRQAFVRLALADTDRRVHEGRAVVPSFLLASLLWHDVLAGWQQHREAGEHAVPALQQAIDAVFDARLGDVSGRGKLGADMREIWMMQPRFERRQSNTAHALIDQPRFRAGFDFLRLRADVGEAPTELADWWEDYSLGSDDDREALLVAVREAHRGAARRVPAARREATAPPAAAGDDAAAAESSTDAGEESAAPARKRRRRRRKPAGGAADESAVDSGGAP